MADCEHKWIHGGVKYEIDPYPLPGTGARQVHYFEWFYCEKNPQHILYIDLKEYSDTYEKIKFNATPKY